MAMAVATGCVDRPGNNYSQYVAIADDGWKYGRQLTFTPTFPDSVARGRLAAAVTHSADYEFDALWLEIQWPDPAGQIKLDTICLALADRYGGWRGTGIGPTLQMADTLAHEVTLTSGRPLKVRHIMKTDTLTGIGQVGIFFIPTP